MADEIADFKEALLQLRRLNIDLQNRSIPISTEILEKHLSLLFQQQEKTEAERMEFLRKIEKQLKKAYILPKSLGILLASLLIILITLIGYLTFKVVKLSEEKVELLREFNIPSLKNTDEVSLQKKN